MASVNVNVDVDVDVDVEVDEFLDECSSAEIKEVLEWLKDNDYTVELPDKSKAIDEQLLKLINCFSLTHGDEEVIKQIAAKYP